MSSVEDDSESTFFATMVALFVLLSVSFITERLDQLPDRIAEALAEKK